MRRRQFLASATVALPVTVAGCVHPPVVLDMDEANTADVADEVSLSPDPESTEYRLVASARDNGTATRRGRYDLFDRTDTVRVDDTFFEVSETRLAQSEVTVYEVLLDFNPDETTPEVGEIEYDDLPEVDRERLDPVLTEADAPAGDRYDIGVDYGSAEEVGESVFVPDRQYDVLIYDGNRYRVAVNSRTASEAEYRYEVTEVAASVEAFADQVRDRYLFTLSSLSASEREVVEEAIEGGYYEDTDPFRTVVERIRGHEGIEVTDSYGTWLVAYDESEYTTYVEW